MVGGWRVGHQGMARVEGGRRGGSESFEYQSHVLVIDQILILALSQFEYLL